MTKQAEPDGDRVILTLTQPRSFVLLLLSLCLVILVSAPKDHKPQDRMVAVIFVLVIFIFLYFKLTYVLPSKFEDQCCMKKLMKRCTYLPFDDVSRGMRDYSVPWE